MGSLNTELLLIILLIHLSNSASPSPEGRREKSVGCDERNFSSPRKSQGWVTILKLLIAVLTAIAGTLGVVSCMS